MGKLLLYRMMHSLCRVGVRLYHSQGCVIEFNFLHTDHLVSEGAFFLGVKTSSSTKVSARCTLVFRDTLFAEVLTLVIGLVLVVFLLVCWHAASFRKTPAREICLVGRKCC
jgi:hypothetical protein